MPLIRKQSPISTPSIIIGGADGNAAPGWKNTIIVNSGVMQIGDPVGMLETTTPSGLNTVERYSAVDQSILGVCVGFGRPNGLVVSFDAGTTDTVTVAADNQTVAQIFALIDITPGAVWSAPLSGTINTTQTAGLGTFFDLVTGANCDQIDETPALRTHADSTGRAVACVGRDPDETGRVLVTIVENVFRGVHADA